MTLLALEGKWGVALSFINGGDNPWRHLLRSSDEARFGTSLYQLVLSQGFLKTQGFSEPARDQRIRRLLKKWKTIYLLFIIHLTVDLKSDKKEHKNYGCIVHTILNYLGQVLFKRLKARSPSPRQNYIPLPERLSSCVLKRVGVLWLTLFLVENTNKRSTAVLKRQVVPGKCAELITKIKNVCLKLSENNKRM